MFVAGLYSKKNINIIHFISSRLNISEETTARVLASQAEAIVDR